MLLREKDRKNLIDIFSTISIPVEVWAYGSRINGNAHDGSDLDLVIRSHNLERLSLNIYNEVCEKIRESNIPILVELKDWAMLPVSFHKNIEQQYEIVFDTIHQAADN